MVLVLKWFRKPTLSQAIALVISLGFLSFVVMAGDALNLINSGLINGELGLLSGTFSDTSNDRMQDNKTVSAKKSKQ
jgi:hypothetical protein